MTRLKRYRGIKIEEYKLEIFRYNYRARFILSFQSIRNEFEDNFLFLEQIDGRKTF